jgi:hypothetical protein
VKYYLFINFHFGGIILSTLNTHTAKWLFVHAMSRFNVLCHGCFPSRHFMTIFTLGPRAFKYTENMLV